MPFAITAEFLQYTKIPVRGKIQKGMISTMQKSLASS